MKLRLDIMLVNANFEFISDLEHARWLKDYVEDKFWLKFELSYLRFKGGLADREAPSFLAYWPASL